MFSLPESGEIYISDGILRDAAEEACTFMAGYRIMTVARAATCCIYFRRKAGYGRQGYRLNIDGHSIVIEAGSSDGAFWGVQTLRQIVAQSGDRKLPVLEIKDRPDFEDRGLYYDVSRGRIPKLERLKELAEQLSHYKVNQFQLYIEHTFLFHGHPEIGKNASPITAGEIMELDEFCRERHIELVPSLASFGHLSAVLKLPRYRHLAEDWGIGRYMSPDADKLPEWQKRIAWSLSPANPAVYVFFESLFGEFLPLFSSNRFNICCDETFDLGLGQSFELCRKRGKGRVYLDHILKLRKLTARYGKKIMFWGDIIRKYPGQLKRIPRDVTLLDWGYDHNHSYDRVRDFKRAGLKFYVCPGTGSWNALFPRLPEAVANIRGFAAAGKKNGASGLLNTDWGDGGHYNFMELSWPEYLFGAEQGWNAGADIKSFARRFCRLFLGSESADLEKALVGLGDVAQLQVRKNRSAWQEIFFAVPGDEILRGTIVDAWISADGKISGAKVKLDAALGRKTVRKLGQVRQVFLSHSRSGKGDLLNVLPYWIFAVDTMIHSARKLTVLGKGGRDSKSNRRLLRSELKSLLGRFRSLWLERNRISEIGITVERYRKVIDSI